MPRFASLPITLAIQSPDGVVRHPTIDATVNVDLVALVVPDDKAADRRCVVYLGSPAEPGMLCPLPIADVLERLTGAPESLAGVDSHALDGRTVCRLIGEAKGEQWSIVQEIRHPDGMVETSEISEGRRIDHAYACEALASDIARCFLESDGGFPRVFRWESAARVVEDWS